MSKLDLPPNISEEEFLAELRTHPDLEFLADMRDLIKGMHQLETTSGKASVVESLLVNSFTALAEKDHGEPGHVAHKTRILLLLSAVVRGIFAQAVKHGNLDEMATYASSRLQEEYDTAFEVATTRPDVIMAILADITHARKMSDEVH